MIIGPMGAAMRRRDFITLLGGAAAAWPIAARGQERVRRLGVHMPVAESDPAAQARLAAFQKALEALGWSEGRNLRSEIRWSAGDRSRMQVQATELASLGLDVILAYSTPVVGALKQATRTTPIVFVVVNDPVAQGIVSNLPNPGGNITGFSFMDYSVLGKGIDLLKKLAPTVHRVGFIFNPETYPYYEVYLSSLLEARDALGVTVTPGRVRSESDIRERITEVARESGTALVIPPDAYTASRRQLILSLARQYQLPTVFTNREVVGDGALMSYGPDQTDIFRRSAVYVDRILKGAAPAGLPIQAPTKFDLVINLKTARALGLDVAPTLLAIADEVIE